MHIASRILPAALVFLFALPCQAAKFDGSEPFICATVDVSDCSPGEDCTRETAAAVNVPQFFMVDVQKKVVTNANSEGERRTSAIQHVEHISSTLVLGGDDGRLAWIATISEKGQMSVSAVGEEVGFVIFGSCIIP